MSDERPAVPKASTGMSSSAAQRLEWTVIGLGVLALALIFQPFSLTLYGIGCALVVFAGLANNLLPLCQPGTAYRSLINAALIVAFAFFVVMLVSISAAHLYGAFFVNERFRSRRGGVPPDPRLPGNVRELRQLMTRIAYRHVGPGPITVGDVPEDERAAVSSAIGPGDDGLEKGIRDAVARGLTLREISAAAGDLAIRLALAEEDGNLQRAAGRLGVTPRALQLRRAAGRLAVAGPNQG